MVTFGERREDRTVSGVLRSYLQKWRDLRFKKRLVILLLLLVSMCRWMAVSGTVKKRERCEEELVVCRDIW